MPRPTPEADAVAEMLAVGWEPQERYPGKTKIPWLVRCLTCGHVSPKRLDTVRRNGQQCAYCVGKKTDPQAAIMEMQAAGITPSVLYPGVDKPWPGTCGMCRRAVKPTLSNIRRNGSGCKYCARTAVDPSEAAAFMQSKGLRPTVPYPSSHAPWPCVCESCGRTVKHSYSDVKAGRRCSHNNSRLRVDPDEAAEFMRSRGLIPTVAFPGAKPQWPCICAICGKAVTPRYSHVRKGVGCPFCVGKGRDPEGNAALVRSKGFTPLEPFVNLRTPWLCQCGACGEAVRVWVTNLRKGHGCPNCTGRYPDAAKAEADMLAHGLRPLVPYPGVDRRSG